MPQNPMLINPALNAANVGTPLRVDAYGALKSSAGGDTPHYNIAASTVVKATAGRLVRVNVLVAGSAAGNAYDTNVAANAAAANLIAVIPNTVGQIIIDWPCATGITIIPGTGQTVSVSYL
ncbi:hypothetical protein [Martelella alba]|uniref:Uncharacterized protein n=1 Tax=Martelella alba TaxID=2590451 RepID=A0ABY2SEB8_9HYPH|nr:hypothetical protein [Martelella alba]TKI02738.1 hypothetical protein FCN80_24155 [Martelella alba]